jgi:hypothetical protein
MTIPATPMDLSVVTSAAIAANSMYGDLDQCAHRLRAARAEATALAVQSKPVSNG